MSYQTKKQSIGYILKGMMDTDVPAKSVKEAVRVAWSLVPDHNQITNDDTLKYAVSICQKLKLDSGLSDVVKSAVFWAFNDKTVGEMGDFFDGFVPAVDPYN
ncbi:hypothetical protein ABEP71_19150, partial [Bacillus velezensis]